jgi:glycosyltransferase involved in cell wall biosynthesis
MLTVAMPAWNASSFIAEAIESILTQKFNDFELLIIDDASTDNTAEIIKGFNDPRIRFIQHTTNVGVTKTRKELISQADSMYFAWMDADDRSEPDRLYRQVAFLESHSSHCLCGTSAIVIDDHGKELGRTKMRLLDQEIKPGLLFGFPFINPTICFRLQALKSILNAIPANIEQAEDFLILCLLLQEGAFCNLSDPLYCYRNHESPTRITNDRNRKAIVEGRIYGWHSILSQLGVTATYEVLFLHNQLVYHRHEITAQHLKSAGGYLSMLAAVRTSNQSRQLLGSHMLCREISMITYMLIMHKQTRLYEGMRLAWQFRNLLLSEQKKMLVPKKILKVLLAWETPISK